MPQLRHDQIRAPKMKNYLFSCVYKKQVTTFLSWLSGRICAVTLDDA